MSEPTTVHSTFVIERTFDAAPARLFAALSDPGTVRRWYGEGDGRQAESFDMDFRVSGRQRLVARMSEATPLPGVPLASEAVYLDIVPQQRVVMAQTMLLGDQRISAALITYEILPSGDGAELVFTHQGAFFERSGGPEMREEGWRHLLDSFAAELMRRAA